MLRSTKFFQSPKLLHPSPSPKSTSQAQSISHSPNLRVIEQCCRISRRELTIGSNSLLLFLFGYQVLDPFYMSKAEAEESFEEDGQITEKKESAEESLEEDVNITERKASAEEIMEEDRKITERKESPEDGPRCKGKNPTKRAFLDISIDGEPVGRITIGLYGDDIPAGVARFSNIVSGTAGITYRRKEFVKITSNYLQHSGLRSYGVDAELAKRTGNNLASETLLEEWERVKEKCPGIKNVAGTVSIIVRDPLKPPPKMKLVARDGKLEIDQEEVGTDPNGTEFIISIKDSPELDDSTLVIGEILEGMQVVNRIAQVKTVKENTSSPYFRVAKLVGDKRAVVAERGFNRPYSKVIVTNCGLVEQ